MKSATHWLFVISCVFGCTESPLQVDGTWNLVGTLGAGTCAPPGRTVTTTTIVTLDDDIYRFQFAQPAADETVSGSAECSADRCDVNITTVERSGTSTITQSSDLEIDQDLVIRGTGTIDMTGAQACSQNFTIAGTIF